jgi:predicted HicB family RNase H-like nuclease
MSDTLQHKGYEGSVLYSAEDNCLHGRLLGIRDMVSYGGNNLKELQKNFHDAVDEYLAFCKESGKEPNVPYKGTFNVRVTPDLHRRVATLAERKNKKLNTVVNEALEAYLEKAS